MFKNLNPSALGISGHQSELIELALTFGFGGLDIPMVEFATRAKLKGMPYARRLIDSGNIKIGTFDLPVNLEADDDQFKAELEKLPECAAAAAEIGCTRCVVTLNPAGDQRPYHENFEFHKTRIAEVCGALAPSGVRLGVGFKAAEYLRKDQPHQFIHDFDAVTLLLSMAGASNAGVVLDVWELVACGGSIDSIRNLPLDQIVAVQVAEMPADVHTDDLDENSRLLPVVEGARIDVAGVLSTLNEMGYDGPVTLVPSRSVFTTRRRDAVVRQAGETLERIWRAAGLPANTKISLPSVQPAAPSKPVDEPAPAEEKAEETASPATEEAKPEAAASE